MSLDAADLALLEVQYLHKETWPPQHVIAELVLRLIAEVRQGRDDHERFITALAVAYDQDEDE